MARVAASLRRSIHSCRYHDRFCWRMGTGHRRIERMCRQQNVRGTISSILSVLRNHLWGGGQWQLIGRVGQGRCIRRRAISWMHRHWATAPIILPSPTVHRPRTTAPIILPSPTVHRRAPLWPVATVIPSVGTGVARSWPSGSWRIWASRLRRKREREEEIDR